MDADDPRPALAAWLDRIAVDDLPRLASGWSEAFSNELGAAHLLLAEHERGDLSHVLGPVLDRVGPLAAFVTEDELLTGERRVEAERALEVLEGAVIAVHAADLIGADRRTVLAAPWRAAMDGRGSDNAVDPPNMERVGAGEGSGPSDEHARDRGHDGRFGTGPLP